MANVIYETTLKDGYKATAKVGRDVFEDIEYFVSERKIIKREKSTKEKIEDFLFDVTIPYYRARYIIKNIYWNIRYGFQRMFRGYDDIETFSISTSFIDRYYRILTMYKSGLYGCPLELSMEEWEDIINEMLYHLHYMDEDHIENELKNNVPKDWIPSYKVIGTIMNKHKDEFFKLFSKYFYNLWD